MGNPNSCSVVYLGLRLLSAVSLFSFARKTSSLLDQIADEKGPSAMFSEPSDSRLVTRAPVPSWIVTMQLRDYDTASHEAGGSLVNSTLLVEPIVNTPEDVARQIYLELQSISYA